MVETKLYDQLVKRIRDAEVAHRKDDPADEELLAAGLEIRLCPQCKTRLEKNKGCPYVQAHSVIFVRVYDPTERVVNNYNCSCHVQEYGLLLMRTQI